MVLMGTFRDEIIFVTQITPVLTKVKLSSVVHLEKSKKYRSNRVIWREKTTFEYLCEIFINKHILSSYQKSVYQKVELSAEILVVLWSKSMQWEPS